MIPDKHLQVGHYITIWIFIAGVLLAGLARGVDIEKSQAVQETRQQAIIQTQAELKEKAKRVEEKQDKILEILYEMKRGTDDR